MKGMKQASKMNLSSQQITKLSSCSKVQKRNLVHYNHTESTNSNYHPPQNTPTYLVEYFHITKGSIGTSTTTSKNMYSGLFTPLMFQKYYYIVSKVLCSSYRKFKGKYVMYTIYMVHVQTYIWLYRIHSQR